ncbi:hypothetical protein H8356DRAFT_1689252 [Neocallimastix lanati (nom. inval.)]|jgi:hypothetical protein|uniref:SH3 domain-containing protein n=1 Tax=Neocallimastix californiae TaxID=1754190 RepID=A0A1Y2F0R9_9FUNG|nr:hypothetical protein H8356DRAFT_1689252 [Neocallimastix sp. JGI-2020a]ORY77478.1 hypothetical protein LY90DRAFT_665260 [Neocallimastix californiae]|eukprot:ORY77478.1 hypothetical protein LY90DRAFT_665260 [Neocallimastix californiae]
MISGNKGISTIISNLTLVISFCFFVIGWLISFISLIVFGEKDFNKSWHWWLIINGLACVAIVFIIIDQELINGYRFALMTYLGICMSWTVGVINELLHNDYSSANAVGVGQLLISITLFIWILYFGCEKDTAVGKLTSSNSSNILRNVQTRNKNPNTSFNLQSTTENSTVIQNEASISIANQSTNLRAEALFDYTANKEDPNEISFTQGEVMDIIDNNGRWWQARKADGTMGIVPSNFFKVI